MAETIRFTGRDSQNNSVVSRLIIATQPPAYDVLVPNGDSGALLSAISAGRLRVGVEAGPLPFRVASAGAFKVAGQQFIPVGGRPRITGAAVASSWVKDGSANRWYVPWTFQARDSIMRNTGSFGDTVCETYADGSNSCFDRDRLYVDGQRAVQVFSLAAGDSATGDRYLIDRTAGRVYCWTNPTGRTVEITKTPAFINGPLVNGVEFKGFAFDRFASPLQRSGISIAGDEWLFDDCDFAHMNSGGMHWSNTANTRVLNSRFYENGQAGLLSGTTAVRADLTVSNNLVENCIFTRDNVERRTYMGDWEAAAIKTTDDAGLTVRGCTIQETNGIGIWVDFGKRQLWENNTIIDCAAGATRVEVAQQVIVRNNTIRGSGWDMGEHYRATHTNWATCMDTAAIPISESQYVEAYGNKVDWDLPAGAKTSLNGIVVNIRGRQDTHHVFVHNNWVQMRSTPIPTGAAGTSTRGTMIAGGVLMSGPPKNPDGTPKTAADYFGVQESWSMTGGSGISATQRVQVRSNHYRVGDRSTTPRFVTRNGATGTGTAYFTGDQYSGLNTQDANDITA